MRMTVYGRWFRETMIEAEIEDLGAGGGEIVCLDCGGDGDLTKFHPEPETLAESPSSPWTVRGKGESWFRSDPA